MLNPSRAYHSDEIINAFQSIVPHELNAIVWGISAYDLARQQPIVAYNADRLFPIASLIKLPIAVALYHEVLEQRLELSRIVRNDPELFTGGSGILCQLSNKVTLTLQDLTTLMLQHSDNVAANLLIREIGKDRINAIIRQFGLRHTKLGVDRIIVTRLEGDVMELGTTTPGEMDELLRLLSRRCILRPSFCDDILTTMYRDSNKQRICGRLPLRPDLYIAHKTGTLDGIYHDVGLLTFSTGRYSVAFLSQGPSDDLANLRISEETIARMSRYLFDVVEEGV
jgi:beta-lactamase class A